jgi:acylphosphatase
MTETQNKKKSRRLIASFNGRVQGVGFRFTTVEIARNYTLAGYVQNMMDGSVKLVAEGSEEELVKFLRDLREAHIYRYVTNEDIHWQDGSGEYEAFVIRYS